MAHGYKHSAPRAGVLASTRGLSGHASLLQHINPGFCATRVERYKENAFWRGDRLKRVSSGKKTIFMKCPINANVEGHGRY